MSKLTNRKSVDVNINAPKDRHVPVFDLQTRLWYTVDYQDLSISKITSGSVTASVDPAYGFSVNANTTISGSTFISGSLIVNGIATLNNLTGSLFGTSSFAAYATTASYALSSSRAISSSYAEQASTASSADNFNVRGTLTAQTLVVQTVTSSVIYSSGSNIFGNKATDTQQFTGSVLVSGSITVQGNVINNLTASWAINAISASISQVAVTASYVQLAASASYALSSSYAVTASYVQLATSASYALSSSFAVTSSYVQLAVSASYALSSSYAVTASYATQAANVTSASYALSSSFAVTASYIKLAASASYTLSSSYAATSSYTTQTLSASYALSSSYAVTASYVPASGITGLDLSKITSGSVTASVDPAYGFRVNANTTISGSTLITGSLEVTGSVNVTGSMLLTNNNAQLSFYGDPLILSRVGNNLEMYAAYDQFLNHSVLTSNYNLTILGDMGNYITLPESNYNGIGINTVAPEASLDVSGSGRYTGGLKVTGSLNVSGSITATGNITAQTLIVQTVTSSIVYSSGSNIFGNSTANTQTFTGSVNITGSLNLIGRGTINNLTGSLFGTSSWAQNALTASYLLGGGGSGSGAAFPYTGSAQITGSLIITGSLSVSNGFSGSFSGSFFGNGSGLTNISVGNFNIFAITTGSVSASVNVGQNIFTITSASSTIFNLSNSGSITVNATGSVPHFFLITSGSKNVFKINNEGVVENKVFEGGNVPTPQYGATYFTSQSVYVGLD